MSFPAIEELVPHRPPMLWLDRVTGRGADSLDCEVTIRPDHAFVRAGRVANVTSIEWMAQSIAALVGILDRDDGGRPRPGYLIAVPKAEFFVDEFAVGQVIQIHVARIWGDDTLAAFEGEVSCAGQRAAEANISVYRAKNMEGPLP